MSQTQNLFQIKTEQTFGTMLSMSPNKGKVFIINIKKGAILGK